MVLEQNAQRAPLLSPNGTLAAVSNLPGTSVAWDNPQMNIYNNGTLTTAVSALAEGWSDNNDLLAANWGFNSTGFGYPGYTGSTIYNASGGAVSTLTLKQLPVLIYSNPTFLSGGLVYDPGSPNAIYSLTTGTLVFQGPSNWTGIGAASASDIVYQASNGVVTIEPFQ